MNHGGNIWFSPCLRGAALLQPLEEQRRLEVRSLQPLTVFQNQHLYQTPFPTQK
eukprot:m.342937 g.342937  ORF g.342937 m.342937 type:complete len:54 (+) comp22059_c0_seq1:63-224(+)